MFGNCKNRAEARAGADKRPYLQSKDFERYLIDQGDKCGRVVKSSAVMREKVLERSLRSRLEVDWRSPDQNRRAR